MYEPSYVLTAQYMMKELHQKCRRLQGGYKGLLFTTELRDRMSFLPTLQPRNLENLPTSCSSSASENSEERYVPKLFYRFKSQTPSSPCSLQLPSFHPQSTIRLFQLRSREAAYLCRPHLWKLQQGYFSLYHRFRLRKQ